MLLKYRVCNIFPIYNLTLVISKFLTFQALEKKAQTRILHKYRA